MKNKLKESLFFFLGIFLLIAMVIFSQIRRTSRSVSQVEYSIDKENGNYFLNKDLLDEILTKNYPNLFNQKINTLKINEIEAVLDKNSFIKTSEVFVSPEGELHADIKQEIPIARVKTNKQEFYLTGEGKAISLSKTFSAKVILIEGNLRQEELKPLSELILKIQKNKLLKSHIIGVEKSGNNFYNFITGDSGFTIGFGTLSELDKKLKKLTVFYSVYMKKLEKNPYKNLNLNYSDQIIASK